MTDSRASAAAVMCAAYRFSLDGPYGSLTADTSSAHILAAQKHEREMRSKQRLDHLTTALPGERTCSRKLC
jgi:hypothetical protein